MALSYNAFFTGALMEKRKLKITAILCVTFGVAVFVCLLVIASFFDLEISKALTKGSLKAGEYYSDNEFALFFEVAGGSVVYLLGGIASLICLTASVKMEDGQPFLFVKELKGTAYKIIKTLLIIVFSAFAVYEMYAFFHDAFKYTDRYLQDAVNGTGASFSLDSGYLTAVQVVIAFIFSGLIFALLLKIKRENIFTLIKLAALILIVEAMYLVFVGLIKGPIGRMRFRTMNAIGDFSYYTPWYKINGVRHVLSDGTIGKGDFDAATLVGATSDTCKSFPSGHTYCAAMSFALVCLPDMFERFKKTYIKALCWVIPAVYTVTVAVTRIVVGAHFLSDVLIGGTLAFTLIIILREALILKGAHIKCFFKNTEKSVED